jgi:hypothetical protein
VKFKHYQWWTAYQFSKNNGFFNGGLQSAFAPEHVFVDSNERLHVVANNDIDLGGGKVWSGAEAVLMFHDDDTEANLGHGDYLVSARLVNGNWSALDPNMAFGLFLYENPATGPERNPAREMDLAELSRWGWNHIGNIQNCPLEKANTFSGFFPNKTLCNGDAQFALQLIPKGNKEQGPLMVDRYDIGQNNEVTLVMRWRNKAVTFEKYNGSHTLNNLPPDPVMNPWGANPNDVPTPPIFTTKPRETLNSLEEFIPQHTANSCERFHINFWFGNYSAGQNPNPPPANRQELIITNFEFRP